MPVQFDMLIVTGPISTIPTEANYTAFLPPHVKLEKEKKSFFEPYDFEKPVFNTDFLLRVCLLLLFCVCVCVFVVVVVLVEQNENHVAPG